MSNNDAVIGCRCCECQGIKCMFWHEGHSCQYPHKKDWLDHLIDIVNNKLEKKDAKQELPSGETDGIREDEPL